MKTRKTKWRAEWLAYFDGWRLVAVAKEGRKWVVVIECATLTQHKLTKVAWSVVPKKEVKRNKVIW